MKPTVGLVVKRATPRARDVAREVVAWLDGHGHAAIAEPDDAPELGVAGASKAEMFSVARAIVVLGGDGTFLATARLSGERPVPIIGVNLGSLGFLTELTTEDLPAALEETLAGRARLAERRMLRAVVRRPGGTSESLQALNDVVLSRGVLGRVVDIEARIDGQELASFTGDGVIVATPTGSTAYALSSGGPIVHPSVRVLVLAPICPHTLSVRPLVIDDESRLELRLRSRNEDLFLSVDGQVPVPVGREDVVEVTRSPHAAVLVRSARLSFYDLLRTKLGWART